MRNETYPYPSLKWKTVTRSDAPKGKPLKRREAVKASNVFVDYRRCKLLTSSAFVPKPLRRLQVEGKSRNATQRLPDRWQDVRA